VILFKISPHSYSILRIVPSTKYELRENAHLLVINNVTVRDFGEYIVVGVFTGGQTQIFRYIL
jgi:hypothetical protein